MNPNSSPRLSLVCRAIRGWAALGGDPEASHLGSHHIARCAGCTHFFAAGRSLDFALKRQATSQFSPAPAGLEDRIIRAVQRSQSETAPRSRPAPRRFVGPIAFAAAAALALAFFLRKPPVPVPSDPPLPSAGVASRSDRVLSAPNLSSAVALLNRNPLEEEAAAVYSDARSAVRFLALNFLPVSPESISPLPKDG